MTLVIDDTPARERIRTQLDSSFIVDGPRHQFTIRIPELRAIDLHLALIDQDPIR